MEKKNNAKEANIPLSVIEEPGDDSQGLNINASSDIFTKEVKLIPKPLFILQGIGKALLKAVLWIVDLLWSMVLSVWHFVQLLYKGVYRGALFIVRFFKRKAHEFKYNDWSGRMSFFIFGTSSFKHKQIVNGCLFIGFEVFYLLFFGLFGINAIGMLSSLGVTPSGSDPNCDDTFCEYIVGDNSVMVLVYGLLWVVSILLFIYIWNRSINSGYDNYRIDHFINFRDAYNLNLDFSNKLDLEVKEAIESGTKKSNFKAEHKTEINNYLDGLMVKGKFVHDFSNYICVNTITNSFEGYKKINKQISKVEKNQTKLDNYNASRVEKRKSLDLNNEKSVSLFDNATQEKAAKIGSLLRKEKNILAEMIKTHSSFAALEETKNDNKYEKYNIYYKTVLDFNNRLVFFKNYHDIVDVFDRSKGKFSDQNSENNSKKVSMQTEEKVKLAAINKKFDEMVIKKAELIEEMKLLQKAQNNEIKTANHGNSAYKAQEVLEIKAKYFSQISSIAGELKDFPEDKVIKALRKEELKECSHSFARDKKYLKTNFTDQSFSKEQTLDYMVVNLKFDRSFAEELFKEIAVMDKKTKVISHYSDIEVNKKINELNTKLQEYINANPTKYVCKVKSFKEQVQSLMNENFHLTILTLPVLGIVLFVIIPLFFSILIAFTNYSFGHIPPTQLFTWAGWLNFNTLFNADPDSMYAILPQAIAQTLSWTLIWTVIATFSNYFLGIILALMINKDGIRLKKLWRTIFIMTIAIPQFISLMSIGVLLKDSGAIGVWWVQTFGYRLGFGTDSTNGALISKIIIIVVNIWVGIPYTMLSTSGILMNIPKDLYESAKVDGAGTFTQFSKITLPYILFVTGPYLITQFIGNINNFNVIYFLTGGGPNLSGTALQIGHTDLLITFIYKMITSNNNPQYGIASAVGILIFVICSFFSIIMYNKSGAVKSEDQFQ